MRLQTRPLLNLFSDKSSLVLRALLKEPTRKWTIPDLMKEGLSEGQVINVLNMLDTRGFIHRNREWRDHYVELVKPKALLDEWVRTYQFHWNWQAFYSVGKPNFVKQLCDYLKRKKIPYALTMITGSRLVDPYVIREMDHIYIGVDRKFVEKTLRGIETQFFLPYAGASGNICLAVPFYRSSVFKDAQIIQGQPVVSNLQLYLDLVNEPLTGADQAAHLMAHLKEKGKPLIGSR